MRPINESILTLPNAAVSGRAVEQLCKFLLPSLSFPFGLRGIPHMKK
jgi:hypothetical protein